MVTCFSYKMIGIGYDGVTSLVDLPPTNELAIRFSTKKKRTYKSTET